MNEDNIQKDGGKMQVVYGSKLFHEILAINDPNPQVTMEKRMAYARAKLNRQKFVDALREKNIRGAAYSTAVAEYDATIGKLW